MHTPIKMNTTVVASQDQIFSDLGNETAILNVEQGHYYGLNTVGTRIWHLLLMPTQVSTIRDTILAEYEVEPALCERHILSLLEQLRTAGLIEIQAQP